MRRWLKAWVLFESAMIVWRLFYEAYHIYYCRPADDKMARRFALYTYLPNRVAWEEIWDNPNW